MSIDVIFDIIGYRGSLQDDLEDVPDNPLGYVDVGSGWTSGGIIGRHTRNNDRGHNEK